jgi:hypothetical protein
VSTNLAYFLKTAKESMFGIFLSNWPLGANKVMKKTAKLLSGGKYM